MRFLLDEMYAPKVAALLGERRHDAVHVADLGLAGAPDEDVLARSVAEGRTLVTENASDFVPLLDLRQVAGLSMTPVLLALKEGRGTGGRLHARLARDIDRWAVAHPQPYAHVHWLD